MPIAEIPTFRKKFLRFCEFSIVFIFDFTQRAKNLCDALPVDRDANFEANLWTLAQRHKGLMVNTG